jgi:alpha-amylase/alpha-mannosidase (GH57 family)
MIYWAPLLHFYQPPTQIYWVLKKVCDESYRPLVRMFQDLPNAVVTVNINAVLTEMLDEHGMSDVIDGLRGLSEQGRLEFTGSAKYHAILPLLSEDEMLRQIVHNNQANRRFFGNTYLPQGFFPPEMCYDRNIVKPVIDAGHRWIILSGVACPAPWTTTSTYEIRSGARNLSVFFRDDYLSNRVSFRQTDASSFIDTLRSLPGNGEDAYVVTAMDAETYGHHIHTKR